MARPCRDEELAHDALARFRYHRVARLRVAHPCARDAPSADRPAPSFPAPAPRRNSRSTQPIEAKTCRDRDEKGNGRLNVLGGGLTPTQIRFLQITSASSENARDLVVLLIGFRGDTAPTWVVPCTNGWKVHAPLQPPQRTDTRRLRFNGKQDGKRYAGLLDSASHFSKYVGAMRGLSPGTSDRSFNSAPK